MKGFKLKNYVKRTKFKALATWEKIREFNFLDYRKKIRDVVIRSIIDSNEYDIICLNDEEFEQVINKINNKDIIILKYLFIHYPSLGLIILFM